MAIDLNDLDAVMKLLDDKIVRTSDGAYIKIEDLRTLRKQFEDSERSETEGRKDIKTMAAARLSALKDPEFAKHFQPSSANSTPVTSHDSAV